MMKQSLHQAVAKILLEEGLQGLTMEHISETAGMAKGTIYNYFKDKEELLQYVVESSMEPLEKRNDLIFSSHEPPLKKLEQFVFSTLSYFDENKAFFRVMFDPELSGLNKPPKRKDRHQQLIKKVGKVIEDGIREGVIKSAPPLKLSAMLVMCCAGITISRFWGDDEKDIKEDAKLVMETFLKGVGKK
jgi:AcrR family transcriptional regulator